MNQANLTRFGPETYELVRGKPTTYTASFRAIDGPAQLILQADGVDSAWVKVNGRDVVGPDDMNGDGEIVVALDLDQENTIEVTVPGMPSGQLGVRVTQVTQADLGLTGQAYFGLNTSDMDRQRAFYGALGFIGEV